MVFVRTSLMVVTLINCGVVNPVIAPAGKHDAVQVKSVPVTSEVRGTRKVVPEQIGNGTGFVRCGVGFTVTTKV